VPELIVFRDLKMVDEGALQRDFFISRASADKEIAAAIGRILREAGFTTWLEEDFGSASFMARIAQGWSSGARLICLLSRAYQQSEYCRSEYEVVLTSDPRNRRERVIVLRVEDCAPVEWLAPLHHVDLIPVLHDAEALRRVVLGAVGVGQDGKDADLAALHRRAPVQVLHPKVSAVPGFTGREAELAALEQALWGAGGGTAAVVAAKGLGGVGKSALAQEYAWRNRARYHGVWWVHADTALHDDLIELGAHFIGGLKEVPERNKAARQALDWIEQGGFEKPWLIVYDNVEKPEQIEGLTPRLKAHALLTTRWSDWGAAASPVAAAPVPVGVLPEEEAKRLLLDSTGRADETGAASLAKALGHLPLALTHAAAYCRLSGTTFADYERLAGDLLYKEDEGPIFATFSLAIAKAVEACPKAEPLMGLCAFLAPDRIPLGLFPVDVLSEVERDEAVIALHKLSLVNLEPLDDDSRAISVHRLVQAVMRERLKRIGEHDNAAALATELVADAYPHDADDVRNWPACARLTPHAMAVFAYAPDSGNGAEKTALLLNQTALNFQSRAAYGEAEPLMQRALAIDEAGLGPDHPRVAIRLNNLAVLLQVTNRLTKAEPLMRRAISIVEAALGPDHPNVAASLNSLAGLLLETRRLGEAESLFRRALAIDEAAYGPDHHRVAIRINNLAQVMKATNRPADAEQLMRRALAIDEAGLGPDHPDVAIRLGNLAGLLSDAGRFDEVGPLRERELAIMERALPKGHPYVATALNNLAHLLLTTGRLAETEPLLRRALAIDKATHGPDHPNVATSLNNLAQLLQATNRLDEAEPLLRRVLEIFEKFERATGHRHPHYEAGLRNLEALEAALRDGTSAAPVQPDDAAAQPRSGKRGFFGGLFPRRM
jgi:tetratricopeptide (TPR) repeat protein